MRSKPANYIYWTEEMEYFLTSNYEKLTNKQLADALGLRLTTTRSKLISLGLKRMEMEYWTDEQVAFLKDNYKQIGDKELASIFNSIWPKKKGWTLKHIEKKRLYLKLNRTRKQLKKIRERNRQSGVWKIGNKKMWQTRGVHPVGTIRRWGKYLYVKLEDRYEKLSRVTWENANGPIPENMNVVRKHPMLPVDDINNLELITNAELGRRNSSGRYPREISQAIQLLNKLNKKINEKQNQ